MFKLSSIKNNILKACGISFVFVFFVSGCASLYFMEGYSPFRYKSDNTDFYVKKNNTKKTSSIYHKFFLDSQEPLSVHIDKNKHSQYIKMIFIYTEQKGVFFDKIKISNIDNEEIIFTLKRYNGYEDIPHTKTTHKRVNIYLNDINIEKILKILLSNGDKKLSLFNQQKLSRYVLSSKRVQAIIETIWLHKKIDIGDSLNPIAK